MINAAIDDGSISHLKSLVLDELHMIDDAHRGYLLEMIGTKILSLEQSTQIVGMSATLPVQSLQAVVSIRILTFIQNLSLMATWLGAHSYETRYKPVPIHEHLVYDGKVYPIASTRSLVRSAEQLNGATATQSGPTPTRRIDPSAHKEFKDPVLNSVLSLAYETASQGYGVLVFAGSRNGCESDARWLSRIMPAPEALNPVLLDKRTDLLSELRSLSTGVDPVLEETVLSGVAFHRRLRRGSSIWPPIC